MMRKMRRSLEKRSLVRPSRRARSSLPASAGRPTAVGRRRQRDVLCDVMLSPSHCDAWLTLEELAKLTQYPPASISAQLRHVRKEKFGGYEVEKQQRVSGRLLRGEDFGTVWEYQLRRGMKRVIPRTRTVQRHSRLNRSAIARRGRSA